MNQEQSQIQINIHVVAGSGGLFQEKKPEPVTPAQPAPATSDQPVPAPQVQPAPAKQAQPAATTQAQPKPATPDQPAATSSSQPAIPDRCNGGRSAPGHRLLGPREKCPKCGYSYTGDYTIVPSPHYGPEKYGKYCDD